MIGLAMENAQVYLYQDTMHVLYVVLNLIQDTQKHYKRMSTKDMLGIFQKIMNCGMVI